MPAPSVPVEIGEAAVAELRTRLRGDSIRPDDPGYDEARLVWNGMIDRRPALIVRCSGPADVIHAVNFARANNLLVSVRGGGHNAAGNAVCDGGIVIDLSRMMGVQVDLDRPTARVQGGVTWGELDHETQVFGLATPGGVVSTTGVAGLTLGGGLGWLRRKHGLSCDNLLSADVVTADGQFLTASPTENSDLFWAIRGGGGNFGVVTSFEFRLHPVGPIIMASVTMYPADQGRDALRYFRDFMATAPEELSAAAFFWSVPAAPALPPAAHNKHVIVLAGVYCGPAADGERITEPLRKFNPPVADLSGKIPFAAHQSGFDPFFPKAVQRYYMKSVYLRDLGNAAIDTVVAHAVSNPDPHAMPILWHLGGAMNRVPGDATAFGLRDAPFMLEITSGWTDPQESDGHIAWTRRFCADMEPYATGKLYVNMPGFGEEEARFAPAAYGTNYERLVSLKNKYDPTNLFRMNQNIRPTA